jgi:hypothetical protein
VRVAVRGTTVVGSGTSGWATGGSGTAEFAVRVAVRGTTVVGSGTSG